jgi:hypothetical protein
MEIYLWIVLKLKILKAAKSKQMLLQHKLICGALANISIFYTTQPLIGRNAAISDPDQQQVLCI